MFYKIETKLCMLLEYFTCWVTGFFNYIFRNIYLPLKVQELCKLLWTDHILFLNFKGVLTATHHRHIYCLNLLLVIFSEFSSKKGRIFFVWEPNFMTYIAVVEVIGLVRLYAWHLQGTKNILVWFELWYSSQIFFKPTVC